MGLDLQTLGAIAGGITTGRRNVGQKKRLDEDREFLKQNRIYQKSQMERQMKQDTARDSLSEGMAAGRTQAQQAAEASGATEYNVDGVPFNDRASAVGYDQAAGAMSQAVTSGQSAPILTPGLYDQGVSQPVATQSPNGTQTMALPASRGIQGAALPANGAPPAAPVQQAQAQMQATPPQAQPAPTTAAAMPDFSESKANVVQYQSPKNADGSANIQEIIRPKKTADALFYQGPWQGKLRAQFEQAYGPDKAMEMDAKLKDAAEAGYKQRVLEAAELQKAGDERGMALKLNEIYNRDYVDGAFSNVRFLRDGRIEVVRFTPDGRIVDRSVQKMPDMINAARQILSPEERAKLLIGSAGKASDRTILQGPEGEAVMFDKVTQEQTPIEGLRPTSMISLDLRKDEMSSREKDRAAANARADEALRRRGELTDAQAITIKKADSAIENARVLHKQWIDTRKAQGASLMPREGTEAYKTWQKAREQKSTEVE